MPCFGGTSVAVLFQQPVLVVAIEVRPDGGADLLDVLEDATENDLLLQRSDEALGDAVGFGLADEGEAGRHAEKGQVVLEVLGHEGAAVVVTQRHPPRGIRADGSKDLADGQRQRLGGSVTVAVLGDMPAETLGVPVLGDDEQRDVAVLDRRNNGAVGAPHDVRRIGGDAAVVVIGGTWWAAMRGEQMVLTHDPQHAGATDPDAVDHPQPGPDLAVALAGPRRPLADHRGRWTAWTSAARPRCPPPQQPQPSLQSLHPSRCSSRFLFRQCRVHRNRVQLRSCSSRTITRLNTSSTPAPAITQTGW